MPKIIILPHVEICPQGEVIDAKSGLSICENLLQNHIENNTLVTRYVHVQHAM